MSFTVDQKGLLIFDKEGKVIGDYSTILAEKETFEERAGVAEKQLQREKELKEAVKRELQRLRERLQEMDISRNNTAKTRATLPSTYRVVF